MSEPTPPRLPTENLSLETRYKQVLDYWNGTGKNTVVPTNRFGFAGGHIPVLFGTDNPLWRMIKAHAQADRFPLAGFDFTIADLGEIGALARYLAEKGQIGGCIDERLATRTAEGDSGVHERCGAAGLIASNIGGQGTAIEDMALQALPQFNGQKASLIPGTEGGHESITVLTDLTGQGTALPAAQLTGARTVGALPFTASISVRNILDFAQQNGGQLSDAQRLVRNVTLFNVGVADRIIGGDHNHLQEVAKAQGVVVVEDQRGLPNDPDTQALIRTYHDTMATIRGGRPTTTIQIA